jgi:predicted solute-binding protein
MTPNEQYLTEACKGYRAIIKLQDAQIASLKAVISVLLFVFARR